MNIDQTFLMNKINQLCERVAILEKKIQYYEGNNLQQNNNFQNNNFLNNNSQGINKIKEEEENKIYDPLSIEVKKNDNTNKQKNILFTNNNIKKNITIMDNYDKIYDPLSN